MTIAPLAIATACYIWAASALLIDGKAALALTYFAYAVANVGLLVVATK